MHAQWCGFPTTSPTLVTSSKPSVSAKGPRTNKSRKGLARSALVRNRSSILPHGNGSRPAMPRGYSWPSGVHPLGDRATTDPAVPALGRRYNGDSPAVVTSIRRPAHHAILDGVSLMNSLIDWCGAAAVLEVEFVGAGGGRSVRSRSRSRSVVVRGWPIAAGRARCVQEAVSAGP